MKPIIVLLILFSFSCKKELTDDYKINFYTDKTAMEISYNDYAGIYKDTTIKANNYSVSFISYRSVGVSAFILGGTLNANLRIQIYKNKKLVRDTTAFTNNLNVVYLK